MVARAERLHRDTAICLALGATRARLWSGQVIEAAIIGALGLGLGLWLASSMSHALARLLPAGQELRFVVDRGVVAMPLALAVLTILALTAVTARYSTSAGISRALKGESLAARLWLRKALIVGQLGLSVIVLAGAALFVQTVTNLGRVPTGFERNQVLIASVAPRGYSPRQRESFYARVLDEVRAIPGVVSAALANDEPLGVTTGWSVTLLRDIVRRRRSRRTSRSASSRRAISHGAAELSQRSSHEPPSKQEIQTNRNTRHLRPCHEPVNCFETSPSECIRRADGPSSDAPQATAWPIAASLLRDDARRAD